MKACTPYHLQRGTRFETTHCTVVRHPTDPVNSTHHHRYRFFKRRNHIRHRNSARVESVYHHLLSNLLYGIRCFRCLGHSFCASPAGISTPFSGYAHGFYSRTVLLLHHPWGFWRATNADLLLARTWRPNWCRNLGSCLPFRCFSNDAGCADDGFCYSILGVHSRERGN